MMIEYGKSWQVVGRANSPVRWCPNLPVRSTRDYEQGYDYELGVKETLPVRLSRVSLSPWSLRRCWSGARSNKSRSAGLASRRWEAQRHRVVAAAWSRGPPNNG